ncbi:MAG: TRAP-type C4-dicarboxylate transport system, periplasmic component [bacterium]|nr:TRAP-type C4-dicarboxylate transport system, periplasmic component [bacterium]
MRWPLLLVVVVSAIAGTGAGADPALRIRMAAVSPEGSSFAREFHAVDREVQASTGGQVQIKWYLGGIAGNEGQALERVHKGQLDGEAGALFCDQLAPTIRLARIVGVFQSREEWHYVTTRLLPRIDAEFARHGFANLGIGSFGDVTFFARRPMRTAAELYSQRFWTYDLDDITTTMLRKMGLQIVSLTVEEAAKAYDDGRVDGFVSTPTVALAFQWSSRARYYSDLTIGQLPGCIVVAQRALDPLPLPQQDAVHAAIANFVGRFEPIGKMQDDALLGGLFERQGLHRSIADPALRARFISDARMARETLAPSLVPRELLTRAMSWLADYRSERRELTPRR